MTMGKIAVCRFQLAKLFNSPNLKELIYIEVVKNVHGNDPESHLIPSQIR